MKSDDRPFSRDIALERIRKCCSAFYEKHKFSLFSIVLIGSLARDDFSPNKKVIDADIVVVSRKSYNPVLCILLKRILTRQIKNIEFDIGFSYPLARLKQEKSLLIYDMKKSGVILAGENIKKVIRDISPMNLYPFEGIRLLMNASCHIVSSLIDDKYLLADEIDKAMRWSLDAFLLYNKRFDPSFIKRKRIVELDFANFYREYENVISCKDLKTKYRLGCSHLLKVMKIICQDLSFKDELTLINYLKKNCDYPLLFRAYSLIMSKQLKSVSINPIFDLYAFAISLIKNPELSFNLSTSSIKSFTEIWEKLPQPVFA